MPRCTWARDELSIEYHDREWGVPVHDDRTLFEFLVLEGAQAGLSWDIILRKRDRYREVFVDFDPRRVARFDARRIARLLDDPGIVRNRLKVESAVSNAAAFLEVQRANGGEGGFARYLWRFVGGEPIDGRRRKMSDIPSSTPVSDALSKDLKRKGFRFVGTTICYAFMQAIGMVNDHLVTCERYAKVARMKR
ncbi:MAG: DNA-3-methyladenine glycosylase I [Phycisphaerae bacterium]|nr:DNA-3-methyladenine glycosylase I [Phycisphaerae bacterium]